MTSPDTDTLVTRLRAAGCVFAEEEAELLLTAATDPEHLESLVAQRIAGYPLEHLLGWAEFRGLRVAVAANVFVPRQRTGFLVEQAVMLGANLIRPDAHIPGLANEATAAGTHVHASSTQQTVAMGGSSMRPDADGAEPTGGASTSERALVALDMCCGCGALGMALASELAAEGIRVELAASDIEHAAVECARVNLAALNGQVFEGDLFEPVPAELAGRVDILLANTPYVPSAEISWMPPEARDHEPRVALDGGVDGLDVLRRIAAVAGEWLAPGGHLLVEESEEQAPVAVEIMRGHGLSARIVECEELGATVVIGTRA
ncbi:methyltransferase [Nocardia sp. NPDC051030]|uniref:methyltransferase n=1 Tax=Nocardia sp. NPDC051030 TaxID=3155162 RepID=UPI003435BD1B